jgi:hypothetical protein
MSFDDLKPEIRLLDDGSLGYFYSPQQLERIRDKKISKLDHIDFIEQLSTYNNTMERH